jgi:hypothetical protein
MARPETFTPKSKNHQLIDHHLLQAGRPVLRSLVLTELASESWESITRWVIKNTGVIVTKTTVWEWFRDDPEIQAARTAAREAKAS